MSIFRFYWLLSGVSSILWLSLGTVAIAQPTAPPSGESNPTTPTLPASPNGESNPTTPTPPTPSPSEEFDPYAPNKPTSPNEKLSPSTVKSLQPDSNPLSRPNQRNQVEIKTEQPITLQQAIELGLQNNRDLQSAKITLERSRAQLDEANAARFPTLSTRFEINHERSVNADISSQISTFNGTTQLFQNSNNLTSTNFLGSIEINYEVYTGGRRAANIAKAQEQIKFSQLDIERVTEQTRFDVADSYYTLQNADAQVLIAQASVEDTTRTLRDAQLLLKAGLGTQFDVLRAEVDLSRAQQDLTQGIANQKIARRKLVQVISLGEQVDLSAADEITEAGNWILSLPDTIIAAYRNRVELNQQLAQREISQQDALVALADIKPQISLFANYSFLDNFDDQVGVGQGYAVGARLSWLFFDGGRAQARAEQAYRSSDLAEVAFAKQREQIRDQVEESYFNLNANKENIGTTRKNVQRSDESLRLARLRFQAGVGTQTDVINAQRDLTTARSQYLQAIVGYNRSLNSLKRAVSNVPLK